MYIFHSNRNYFYAIVCVLLLSNIIAALRVENLKEINKDASSITIEWDVFNKITDNDVKNTENSKFSFAKANVNSQNDWIGFKIKYFTDKFQFTPILLKNTNLRKFRLDTLKSNTEYKIQVSAFNRNEFEGPASNLLTVKTSESVPGEPQDFKVVKVTSTSIDLEWKPPRKEEQTSNTNIKGYEIHYAKISPNLTLSSSSDFNQIDEPTIYKHKTNEKKLKHSIAGLEPNTLYKIQIFAFNVKGDGQRSNSLHVNTLDEGLIKPYNIRSEIYNNKLIIKWHKVSVANAPAEQPIIGYRIFFNNAKYEVDNNTNQLEPKNWEYDRQYEFRISPKSINSKNVAFFGQEAIYRISTHTNQTKIIIQLEKITSTSILIRWNSILFAQNNKYDTIYKLQYWLKSHPDNITAFDNLTTTELSLSNLKHNSDYIIQIVAFAQPSREGGASASMPSENQIFTTQTALRHFRTLLIDIDAPSNLQVVRFEKDKINIKWDPVLMQNPNDQADQAISLIKGYRIYYKELLVDEYSSSYDLDSDEWKIIEQFGDKNTEATLEDINIYSDYAIKIVPFDFSNNEGPASPTKIAYKLSSAESLNSKENVLQRERNSLTKNLDIVEHTSTSVKFSWISPIAKSSASASASASEIKNFLISYSDRKKAFRDVNGSVVQFVKGVKMTVKVPPKNRLSSDDTSLKMTWLVSGLLPFTEYDFAISALYSSGDDTADQLYKCTIQTKKDRPARVDKPYVLDVYTDNTVLVRMGNASEKNGPISKYWLIVTPIGYAPLASGAHSKKSKSKYNYNYNNKQQQQQLQQQQQQQQNHQQQQQQQHIDDEKAHSAFETRDRSITGLLVYSYNSSHSNESTYITAEFDALNYPSLFVLGDGNTIGRFINRRLTSGYDYKAYIVAFTQVSENTPQSTKAKQHQQQQQQQHQATVNNLNMVGLSEIMKPSAIVNNYADEDLYTASSYSDTFNTNNIDSSAASSQNTIVNGLVVKDFHNILWVAGAIASFIFLFIIIIVLSLHVMHKKSKTLSSSTAHTNILQTSVGGNGVGSAALSPLRHDLAASSSSGAHHLGLINSNAHHVKMNEQQQQQQQHQQNNTLNIKHRLNGDVSPASPSSSVSSIRNSPTTALLNCSTTDNNQCLISQSANVTTTNSITNGLLKTASPLRNNNTGTLTNNANLNSQRNVADSLYTSIEVSQHLFSQQQQQQQQQQHQQKIIDNSNESNYNSSINNQLVAFNSFKGGGGGGGVGSSSVINDFSTDESNFYDPIELKRMQYPAAAAAAVDSMKPFMPIRLQDLAQYVERLKMHLPNSSTKLLTLEYESIQPCQQFTWEHSSREANRLKNRYANVIAYDHSRVVLSKLASSSSASALAASASSHYSYHSAHSKSSTVSLSNSSLHIANSSTFQYPLRDKDEADQFLQSPLHHKQQQQHYQQLQQQQQQQQQQQIHYNGFEDGSHSVAPYLDTASDYINANYMDGFRKQRCYIATQGPLPSTYGDFWRMVWEQQTYTIVMMTRLEERSRLKCDQYWPSKGSELYGATMQVTLVDFTELATCSIRTFIIAPANAYAQTQLAHNSHNMSFEMRREVKHFQYTAWPDHGVPDHATPFLMFLRRVHNANPAESGPVVVHCSAGVGRTGCYIVIDTMLKKLRCHELAATGGDGSDGGNEGDHGDHDTDHVDIYGHVTRLRSQRNYMVQTEEQYQFCYDAVLEATQSGHTDICARDLYQHLQNLLQISCSEPSLMLTEMELEYKRLSNIKAPQSKFQSAHLAVNKFKNRLVNILPYETTRVCLRALTLNETEAAGSDYINANFLDGYKYRQAYIATQAPLVETIDDFWRMLWEHNSSLVVMLTKLREMGREKCAQYWPSDRSVRYQFFVVDPIAEYNMYQYILREFKVTDARDGQSRTIRQFQFVDWPEQGVPKSGESIVELIGQVHKTKEQFGQVGPITVHCSAGVGRTGVFVTLSIVLERLRYEGIIDVYNTVKILRTQRPAMVQTEDQYQFCYRAALEYLGSFENFE